jgi:uncharacterized delta-60 repeat protein
MLNSRTFRVRRALVALTLAFIFACFIPARRAQAAIGDLDPTFGVGGKVTTHFGSLDVATDLVIQPDGKIVAAGYGVGAGPEVDFAVARYNPDGSLDPTFGSGGKVITDFPGQSEAMAIALQSDGKIVVAGSANGPMGFDSVMVRYDSNGNLDATFGSGGKVVDSFSGLNDVISDIAIQPDGKIVAGGGVETVFGSEFMVARFNPNGSLDTGFGVNGSVVTEFFRLNDGLQAIALQPDGKIIAAGLAGTGAFDSAFAVARYNSDGSPDQSFGVDGKATVAFSGRLNQAKGVALQGDGKIVLAGSSWLPVEVNSTDFALARFNSNGTLDTGFGSGGKVSTDFQSRDDQAFDVISQPDGKIIAVGWTDADIASGNFALTRYNSDGSLDLSFGLGGNVSTDFSGKLEQAFAVALQPDGKIIAAGASLSNLTGYDFALARYSVSPTTYDLCVQDDSNGNLLQLNSTTGEYLFTNCAGVTVGGKGTVTRRGNTLTLQHNANDRRVMSTIDTGAHRASASVQLLAVGKTFSITDRNTANNTCACK